jgi:hypothetical protein
VSPYSNCSKIKRGEGLVVQQTATEKSLDAANYKTLGDEKKKSLGEGLVFISSNRSRVNQELKILCLPQDIAHFKQSCAS